MPKNSIGEFIAILRKSNGYTQQEVADRLGVSNKTVSSWETGASCPDIAMLPAIAELFGVTCDELLRGERIAAGENAEVSQKKRDKALSFQMARYKNNLSIAAAVSYGLAAAGVLLSLILGFAALRSRLGFWLGLVLLLASVLTAVIACKRIGFLASADEFDDSALASLRGDIFCTQGTTLLVCAAAFGFIFPHSLVPAYGGLTAPYAFLYGSIGAAAALLVGTPIYFAVKSHKRIFTDAEQKRAKFTMNNILLCFGLAALAILIWLIIANWLAGTVYYSGVPGWFAALHYIVYVLLLAAAAVCFILRRKKFLQNEKDRKDAA